MLHTRISFTYHRRYVYLLTLAPDSIVQSLSLSLPLYYVAEGRGKKKKIYLLLPLLLFFKLKMLLVPILLGVLFIKKLLILGAVLLPSLMSLVKLCKPNLPHSYAGWNSAPDASGEYSTGYSHSLPYHSEYHGRRTARWEPQALAYRGYQRSNDDQTGI